MRALIRSTSTKLYYTPTGDWRADRIAARDFRAGAYAIPFAMQAGLKDIEVVLVFEDPKDDILLPIGPTRPQASARL